jgi:hypothetical protein
VSGGAILARALRDPASVKTLDANGWTALFSIARAEQLLGTLAYKLSALDLPEAIEAAIADARLNAEYQHRTALWEADSARRALLDFDGTIALMKGTAYVAAGLKAGQGRHIGDLDIMVAEDQISQAEQLLLTKGGWEWVKEDAYDDAYYRTHMHELPPLIHKERDRMIDVHHTILPKTARPRPDAAAMLEDAIDLDDGLSVFSPEDMVCHCAAHLIADGDLTGGMRNLWDMHCLLSEFAERDAQFWEQLGSRARHHQLWSAVSRAARLSARLYGTQIPVSWAAPRWQDGWYIRRILARDGWGRGTGKIVQLLFYIRSHWMRMPPMMLARHLWTKWRKA